MNRADQAPEPSIEELLASIRLIISDADKQGSFQKEPRAAGMPYPAGRHPAGYAQGDVPADEVFDLTDELVFPEEAARLMPAPPQAGMRHPPAPDGLQIAQRRGLALPGPEGAQPTTAGRAGQERPDSAFAPRPEARNNAQAPVAKPMWSRREHPAEAAQHAAAPARPRQEQTSARTPARNWAADIQMPVSDQGPVPLFPASPVRGQPEMASADSARVAGKQAGVEAEPEPTLGNAEGSAAVAALAQRLARSAIGVLEASELENAKQVDFEHLDAGSRAEVTEKFADAIEIVAHTAVKRIRNFRKSWMGNCRRSQRKCSRPLK